MKASMRRLEPFKGLLLLCGILLCAGVAMAAPIPISNPGFESPSYADGGWQSGLPGWVTFGGVGYGGGIFNPTTTQYAAEAPEGSNVGWVVSYNSAGITQTLPATFQAGYTCG